MEQTHPDPPSDHNSSRQSFSEMKQETTNFATQVPGSLIGCDPEAILKNLSFLEQKIHDVQDALRAFMDTGIPPHDEFASKHQLMAANLTSIVVQIISAAGTLIPSLTSAAMPPSASTIPPPVEEDRELNGNYEVLQLEKEEILAPHTHFCMICGKGFKRDANLRMHMRGHGEEYKSLAALSKPGKDQSSEHTVVRRYSCPFAGCKRNKDHKKFQPLKTILCVKNHYKRTHCAKSFTCSRCKSKKFSVIADLKTHEKHCGRDKWVCSCGTTFSRKDKLFGHVSLFQGHTPAVAPPAETPPPENAFEINGMENEVCALSPYMNFDPFDFGGGGEFMEPEFESPDCTFFSSSGIS